MHEPEPPATPPRSGPEGRESFFAAQARHRRASWKLQTLCLFAVALMGIPVAMVVSPLLIGAAVLITDVISLFTPAPNVLAAIGNLTDRYEGPWSGLAFYALLALPGIAVVAPAFWLVHRLLRRGGVGSILLSLGARPPRPEDLEERQLENVLQEMALAANAKPPQLRLLDGEGVSAAAVGTGPEDAVVVVSRGMLDQLDRDQTQAIVGHLVASIGNGDLRLANLILSVHATLSLIEAVTFVAVSPDVRARVREVLAAARHVDAAPEEDVHRLSRALLAGLVPSNAEDLLVPPGKRPRRPGPPLPSAPRDGEPMWRERLRHLLGYPFVFTWMLLHLCRLAFLRLGTDPLMSLLWRRRRDLADAASVQLTRQPTALAFALLSLGAIEAPLPGGPWTSFLFAAGPRRRIGAGPIASFGHEPSELAVDCLPSVGARVERLRRLGAEVLPRGPRHSGSGAAFLYAWDVVYVVLLGSVWAFSFGMTTLSTVLGFFMIPMCLIPLVGVPHVLLRMTVPWLLGR